MPIVNRKQLFHFLDVLSFGVMPAKYFLNKRWKINVHNFYLVTGLVLLIYLIDKLDAFPSAPSFSAQSGSIAPIVTGGISSVGLYFKIFACIVFVLMFFISFIIDLKHAITGEEIPDIYYKDDELTSDSKVYYSVLLLIVGFVIRVILLSILFLIGLETINVGSVTEYGYSIFSSGDMPDFSGGFLGKIMTALNQPLSLWNARNGPFIWGDCFLFFAGLVKIVILTFLLGIFLEIITGIRSMFREPHGE